MGNIIYPFPLPVYQGFIVEKSFNIIKEDTYNFISQNIELFESIWDCPTKTTQHLPKHKNIKNTHLETQIKSNVENYFKVWDFNKSYNLKISEVWVNIAKKGEYQEEHHHGKSLFSGVLYINVNELSGNFNITNPLSSEGILMDFPDNLSNKYIIPPQNGMIILFPGWLTIQIKIEYQYHLI